MTWQKAALVGVGAFVVLGSLMVPASAGSPQSLVGTSTATGVASDLSKTSGANVLGARDRVKGVAQKATDRSELANEVMGDEPSGSQASVETPSDLMPLDVMLGQFVADPAKAEADLNGKSVHVLGVVKEVQSDADFTYLFVVPENANADSPGFFVRLVGGKSPFKKGSTISMPARLSGRHFDEDMGVYVYFFEAGPNPQQQLQAQQPAAPVVPEVPFAGWRFLGSVENADGVTGVFMRDGETLYAQPGDKLDDSVTVKSMSMGTAVLKSGDEEQVVLSW